MTVHHSQPNTAVPAGWYPNQYGQLQWWDGFAWGPLADAPPPTPRVNGFAVTALVAAILVIPAGLLALFSGTVWPVYTLGLLPIILAVTFGFLGLHRAKSTGTGKQLAIVALILAAFFVLFPLLRVLQSFA